MPARKERLQVGAVSSRILPQIPDRKPGKGPPEILKHDDGQWLQAAKDFTNTRFSRFAEINTGNANQLKLLWTFSTGQTRGHEAAPLAVNNTVYIVTSFPNYLTRGRIRTMHTLYREANVCTNLSTASVATLTAAEA